MSKSFAKKFAESLGQAQKPGFREAYDTLRGIADGIRKTLSAGKKKGVVVDLEPGYATNLGQQFRVRLRVPARGWDQNLFRAYIPPDGFPISLDLDGEQPVTCPDAASLEQAVLDFLRKPEIDGRLTVLRESV